MDKRYVAGLEILALGDTLGFKNGEWIFDFQTSGFDEALSIEMLCEFMKLGGVNQINLKDWKLSSCSMFNIAIGNALLEYEISDGEMPLKQTKMIKNYIIDIYNEILDDEAKRKTLRFMELTMENAIGKFEDDYDARNELFNSKSKDHSCATYSMLFGMAFYREEDLESLIKTTITVNKFTHNNPHAFLGGVTSALFASFAIRDIEIDKWPELLIKILNSSVIKKYIDRENDDEYFAYRSYVNYWSRYIEMRFKDGKIVRTRAHVNMLLRLHFFYINFLKGEELEVLGNTGYCSTIMSYDALLDSDGIWEKFIFYGILNPSESRAIGTIGGCLYGLKYGYGDIPQSQLKYIEKKYVFTNLGKKLYLKYFN